MECRIGDLRYKEVINVNTGVRLGFVSDGIFDSGSGRMVALVVPGAYRIMGLFGRSEDYVIPWNAIRRIGDDIILVEDDRVESRPKRAKQKPVEPCREEKQACRVS